MEGITMISNLSEIYESDVAEICAEFSDALASRLISEPDKALQIISNIATILNCKLDIKFIAKE